MEFFNRFTGFFSSSAPRAAQEGDEGVQRGRGEDLGRDDGREVGDRDMEVDDVHEEQDEMEQVVQKGRDVNAPRPTRILPPPKASMGRNSRGQSGGSVKAKDASVADSSIITNSGSVSTWRPIPPSSFARGSPRVQSPALEDTEPLADGQLGGIDDDDDIEGASPPRRSNGFKWGLQGAGVAWGSSGSSLDEDEVEDAQDARFERETRGHKRKHKGEQRGEKHSSKKSRGYEFADDLDDDSSASQEMSEDDDEDENEAVGAVEDEVLSALREKDVGDSDADSDYMEPLEQESEAEDSNTSDDELEFGAPYSNMKTRILPGPSNSKTSTTIRPNSTQTPIMSTPRRILPPFATPKPILPPTRSLSSSKKTIIEPVTIRSPAEVMERLARTTPQVVITSRPRPSLLSIVHSREELEDASSSDAESEVSQASEESVVEVYEPAWRKALQAAERKRQLEAPGFGSTAKRWKGIKQEKEWAPLGDDIARFGAASTPKSNAKVASSRSSSVSIAKNPQRLLAATQQSIPESTPGRILPPASLFRFSKSHTQIEASSAPPLSAVKPPSKPVFLSTPSNLTSIKRIIPSTGSGSSSASTPSRQTTLQSFVIRHENNIGVAAMKATESSQKKSSAMRDQSLDDQADIDMADDDAPYLNYDDAEEDEMPSSYLANRDHPAKSSMTSTGHSRSVQLSKRSPPQSNIRRKRRLPSMDAQAPSPAKGQASLNTHSRPSNAASKQNTERGRTDQSSQAANSSQPREDSKLRVRNLTPAEIEAIERSVENYCHNHDLDRPALNALVLISPREGDDSVKEFWQTIYDEVPGVTAIKIRNYCQRRYHSFIRGPWTEEQDQQLRDAYEQFPKQWRVISEVVNRSAEDVRCRWRDALSYGDEVKKDVWSLDEESKLRRAYAECRARVRFEQIQSDDPEIRSLAPDDLIDWAIVSQTMGGSRTRLQCYHKWLKIQEREAEESHRLGSLGDTKWRMKAATTEASNFTTEDKIRIVRAIQDCGAASEEKIPWKNLSKDLDMTGSRALGMKVALRRLRMNVPGHRQMNLQDTLIAIINDLNGTPPADSRFETPGSHSRSVAGHSSSRKRVKKYSLSKRRSPVVPLELASDPETVDPKKSTPTVRERMRRSDQTINKDQISHQPRVNAENLADELRSVWSQPGSSVRAKQPIFQPRVSKRSTSLEESIDDVSEASRASKDASEVSSDDNDDTSQMSHNDPAELISSDESEDADSVVDEGDPEEGIILARDDDSKADSENEDSSDNPDVENLDAEVDENVEEDDFDDEDVETDSHSIADDSQKDFIYSPRIEESAEVKEEEISDNEGMSSIEESQETSSSYSRPRNAFVDDEASETSSEVEDPSESDVERMEIDELDEISTTDSQSQQSNVEEAHDEAEEARDYKQDFAKYRSPSPDELSGDHHAVAAYEDHKSARRVIVEPTLSSPTPSSPEIYESSFEARYPNTKVGIARSRKSQSHDHGHGSSSIHASSERTPIRPPTPKTKKKVYGEGYLADDDDHHIVMKGWTPRRDLGPKSNEVEDSQEYDSSQPSTTSNDSGSQRGQLAGSLDHEDIKYPTLPSVTDSVSDSEDEQLVGTGHRDSQQEEQEVPVESKVSQVNGNGKVAWDYQRWIRERDAPDYDSTDSDSDASSIPAVAVPRLPRYVRDASLEL